MLEESGLNGTMSLIKNIWKMSSEESQAEGQSRNEEIIISEDFPIIETDS